MVTEGTFEGKIGKITEHIQDSYTLIMKNGATNVLKRRSQIHRIVEDDTDRAPGGYSPDDKFRYTRTRRGEWYNKRVQILGTGQLGTVIRSGHGFYTVVLDDDADVSEHLWLHFSLSMYMNPGYVP